MFFLKYILILSLIIEAKQLSLFRALNYNTLYSSELNCNKIKSKAYESGRFRDESFYLYDFFKQLNKRRCFKSINEECKYESFLFSEYTTLVYYRFCNINKLKSYCIPHLVDQTGFNETFLNHNNWKNISNILFTAAKNKLILNDLHNCLALVILESIEYHKEINYMEVKEFNQNLCSMWSIKLTENKNKIVTSPISER